MLIDHVIAGKYRITELIGQGGMGTVFEAVHTGTGSRVAIKLIVSSDIKEEVFVRFQREARAAGTIDSHHIVRIFDMGTDETSGSPFMVMERLYGEDLSQLMRRVGPLSPEVSCALVAQAALGLGKAHEKGVVHRDIKPANLFLHDNGDTGEVVVKLLDFGIAKVLMDVMHRSEEGGLTRTGSMLGSPHYMSPEQAQGLRTIDQRSDIWSLGVVLYKMLTGQTPHAHLQTLGQVILAICSQPARPVQELAPWVPPEVANIVHRALQPDPAQRFQTAYEMVAALQPVFQGMAAFRRVDIQPLSSTQRMRVAAPAGYRGDVPTNGTQNGVAQSALPPAPSRSGLVAFAIATGIVSAMGIAGVGLFVKRQHAATAKAAASAVATANATTTQAPAVAAPERTVSLSVSPAGATITVDGIKREPVDGVVELKGALGSVVSVQIAADGVETTQAVAITEGGAIPPRLALQPPVTVPSATVPTSAATAASTTRGSRSGTAPAAKPVPTATGTTLNAQRTFE